MINRIFINGMSYPHMTPLTSLETIENRQPGEIHSVIVDFDQLGERNEMLFAAPKRLKLTAGMSRSMNDETPFLMMNISRVSKVTGSHNEKGEARLTEFAKMIRERLSTLKDS